MFLLVLLRNKLSVCVCVGVYVCVSLCADLPSHKPTNERNKPGWHGKRSHPNPTGSLESVGDASSQLRAVWSFAVPVKTQHRNWVVLENQWWGFPTPYCCDTFTRWLILTLVQIIFVTRRWRSLLFINKAAASPSGQRDELDINKVQRRVEVNPETDKKWQIWVWLWTLGTANGTVII